MGSDRKRKRQEEEEEENREEGGGRKDRKEKKKSSKKERKKEEEAGEQHKRKKKKKSSKDEKKKKKKKDTQEGGSKAKKSSSSKKKRDKKDVGSSKGVEMSSKALLSLVRHHPHVAQELFLVLKALDAGQGVALDGISDLGMRKRMTTLLGQGCKGLATRLEGISVTTTYYLPTPSSSAAAAQARSKEGREDKGSSPGEGATGVTLVVMVVVMVVVVMMVVTRQGVGGGDLLLRAALAAVDKILGPLPDVSLAQGAVNDLLCRFPALEGEVPGLLARVATTGERIVVAGLEDEGLRAGLIKVFEALGLTLGKEDDGDEEGYGLVKRGGTGRTEQRERVRELVLRNGGQLDIGDGDDDGDDGDGGKDTSVVATAEVPTTEQQQGEQAGGAEVEGRAAGTKKKAVMVGPAMPDASVLAEAQARAAEMMMMQQEQDSDEEDEDVVGPSLGDTREAVPDHIAFRHLESRQAAKGGREEWMTMGPGVQSLASLQPSMKGRAFTQRSERAKNAAPSVDKRAPLTPAQMEQMRADAAKDKQRKTLLEKHQEKIAKGGGAAAKEEPLARKAWNREEFIEGRKTMDSRQAQKLFEQAKDLGTRFSRSFR